MPCSNDVESVGSGKVSCWRPPRPSIRIPQSQGSEHKEPAEPRRKLGGLCFRRNKP
jgi:hypothetical protein